jgi:hypothetical protein
MTIILGLIALFIIYVLYKLFIDGWLFKGILFIAGWFGLYIWLFYYVEGGRHIAFTYQGDGANMSFTWASVIPTAVCLMALLCTRTGD